MATKQLPDVSVEIDGCTVEIYTNRLPGMSWRCGYVTFPESDNLTPGVDYENVGGIPVNGGITYHEGRTLGWDYNHSFNMRNGSTLPSDETVFDDAKKLIARMRRPR